MTKATRSVGSTSRKCGGVLRMRQVVDASEPQESIAELTELWRVEIERRAAHVRSGASMGSPAADVFARVEAKQKQR